MLRTTILLIALSSCAPPENLDTEPSENTSETLPFSCPVGEEEPSLGNVQHPDITETSGIGQSNKDPEVIWLHNDSGDGAFVYAIDTTGSSIGTIELDTPAIDWEDMSTVQLPDSPPYIYVGDIGDNALARATVFIHRITEPENIDEPISFTTFIASYPDGPHNAETLVVHPITGAVYILTKDIETTHIFRLNEEDETLEQVYQFSFSEHDMEGSPLITGGDISPDGSTLLLRTYTHVWALDTNILDGEEIEDVCTMPGAPEEQGEAITFLGNDRYITISEGENPSIHQFSYTQE